MAPNTNKYNTNNNNQSNISPTTNKYNSNKNSHTIVSPKTNIKQTAIVRQMCHPTKKKKYSSNNNIQSNVSSYTNKHNTSNNMQELRYPTTTKCKYNTNIIACRHDISLHSPRYWRDCIIERIDVNEAIYCHSGAVKITLDWI